MWRFKRERPSIRKRGHVFLECSKHDKIFYTRNKLVKLHRILSHPTSYMLPNLFKISKSFKVDEKKTYVLKDIVRQCGPSQRILPSLSRFCVWISDETKMAFGEELSLDMTFLDGKALLLTWLLLPLFWCNFSWLKWRVVWKNLWWSVTCIFIPWCTIYTNYPNRLHTDQGSVFSSQRPKQPTGVVGVIPTLSLWESLQFSSY